MKVLIIEDEQAASQRLVQLLNQLDGSIQVQAVLESVEDAVARLTNHAPPDLIFADIQLSDGLCFDIFKRIPVECPVIFTTAFDEYAVKAFKVNSIDYLLKPIHPEELGQSIQKYRRLKAAFEPQSKLRLAALLEQMETIRPSYKTRFLVKSGQALQPIETSQIRYVMIADQLAFLVTRSGKRFVVDHTLDELEVQLDPKQFFRINRQMIVALGAVQAIHPYFNSRLKLVLDPPLPEEVLVSRTKVNAFKNWLDQ